MAFPDLSTRENRQGIPSGRMGRTVYDVVETSYKAPGYDFYRESMRILNEAGIPYLVGGAYAVRAYTGVVRDTKDFDLMVRGRDVDGILQTLRQAGYRADLAFTHWLAKVHYGEAFIDIIFNAGNGICPVDDTWFEHARDLELLGMAVKLCPPEELIWQKAYIMERERFDGADIVHLIRSCGADLDWRRLIRRFESNWRVLLAHLVLFGFVYPAERDRIPSAVLRELAAKISDDSDSPSTDENVCMGTLLSREQYLPDIERWGFLDGRKTDVRCRMTDEQLQAWTAAIGCDPGKKG